MALMSSMLQPNAPEQAGYQPMNPSLFALGQPTAPASYTPPAPPSVGASLLNTGSNYNFPLTSGLLGGLQSGMQPPQKPTDYTAQALQLAGYPKAGPLPAAGVPSGAAVGYAPNSPAVASGSSGSPIGSTALGIMGTLARNPSMVTGLKNLMGIGGSTAATALPALTASDVAASDAALGSGALTADIGPAADAGMADATAALGSGAGGASSVAPLVADYSGAGAGATDTALQAGLAANDYDIPMGAGADAASGAGGAGGAGSALAAAGPGLAFGAGMYGLYKIFQNQNENPETYATDANRASATLAAQAAAQKNPVYAQALQEASSLWQHLGQAALNGNYSILPAASGSQNANRNFLQKA